MSSIALQFKSVAIAKKLATKIDQLAEEYEAETIRKTADDYDEFQLLVNSLETDFKKLSGLSIGDKNKQKQESLLPKYISAVQKYIEGGESYRNPVLVEVIIMLLDTGQISEAMEFIHCAMDQKQPMPERFKKSNLPTFIADSVLTWASAQIARGNSHEPEFSEIFDAMVNDGWKVPRELVAKYHKLAGDVDSSKDQLENALEHFVRATEIDPAGAKCATKINQLKKKLGRLNDSTTPTPGRHKSKQILLVRSLFLLSCPGSKVLDFAMNSFSGKHPEPANGKISNQPFWPDIDIGVFCRDYRVPGELDTGTIKAHLSHAMLETNIQLIDYRDRKVNEGYDSLKEVPAETIADESRLLMLYRRAVSCRCKAIICRDYPTIDRREPADNQAKTSYDTEVSNLCNADKAIRAFLELSDITVDLL